MSEKPGDGTVAMLYGEVDQGDFHSVEDHLPTLPNTVSFTRLTTASLVVGSISLLNDGSWPIFFGVINCCCPIEVLKLSPQSLIEIPKTRSSNF